MKTTLVALRQRAIRSSFGTPATLRQVMARMGFVQADPIRSPARAQDLILRQRVRDYKINDLDRAYKRLQLEEDFLYAYGYMPQSTWRLLHPRSRGHLSPSEEQILKLLSTRKGVHPRELDAHFQSKREVNAWGGYSKATTRSLERLQYLGYLRISGREAGVKLYETRSLPPNLLSPDECLKALVLIVGRLLAPLPETSLRKAIQHLGYAAPHLTGRREVVRALLKSGELEAERVGDVNFVWPADSRKARGDLEQVRFLAPFDPLVWDRFRFELFWDWQYRFEAYTPPARRKLGYYAMPLLWQDDVIGWVNIGVREGQLAVEPGFIKSRPTRDSKFWQAFEAEKESFRAFLLPAV